MFVCASTSVVFDARQVAMTRQRLADDERWAMLNKTTFQEILNAILVQSTFPLPNHQPPPPPPPPLPSSSAIRGQRSTTLSRPTKKLIGGTRGGGGCDGGKEGTATKFCFVGEREGGGGGGAGGGEEGRGGGGGGGGNSSTDLAPARENEILTRIEGDEREKDNRCGGRNEGNDLHLARPSASSSTSSSASSSSAAAAAGGLTSSNISASLQKNLSVVRNNSAKISDLQRRNPTKGLGMQLTYSVPLQSQPQILSGAAPEGENVDRPHHHHPERLKGVARKCSLGVTSTSRKAGAGNENICAKDPSLVSPLSTPLVKEGESRTPDEKNTGDQEKREDGVEDGSRDPIPETRGSRSPSLQKGSKEEEEEEEEDLGSENRSVEDRRDKLGDAASLDVATESVDSSGLLRCSSGDRVDHGTISQPPRPLLNRLDPPSLLGGVTNRPPTTVANRTLQARNRDAKSSAEDISRRQPAFADDDEKEKEEVKRSLEGQGQMTVAIGNYHDDDLMKENGAFGLPWSRWIAMDKGVLLCIIEHVLSVDIFGSKTTNQMFSLTTTTKKKNNTVERTRLRRTECYPVPSHPPECLQWLRPCRPLDSSDNKGAGECQELSDGVRSVGVGSGDSFEVPRNNNQRSIVHTDSTTANTASTANTVSVVSNSKPTRRARSGVLLLRRKRRGLGPPTSRSLRPEINNGDNSGGSVEGNGGAAPPADCDAAAHDKSRSSFKWKSEMITRLIHETKSRQNLAEVS